MKNISSIKDCYGCGMCAVVCAKHIVEIKLNEEGFYQPYITDLDKCTNCGICADICAFNHEDIAPVQSNIKSYATWSNDDRIRNRCTSGGIGFEIGKQLIEKGYKVCGVKYNTNTERAEHYVASTIEELIPTIGSKYIQSYTVDGFKAIDRKQKNLVVGTPCQMDSFRRYIRKFKVEDNFILLDFFCHSVPSMLIWQKYTQIVKRQVGEIVCASWRNKFNWVDDSWPYKIYDNNVSGENVGWQDSTNVVIQGEKGFYNNRFSKRDMFFRMFIGDFSCNPACIKSCKYKYKSSAADLRMGDLWGGVYKENNIGVSGIASLTEQGDKIIQSLKNCTVIEHSFEVVAEGQMQKNGHNAYVTPIAKWMLKARFNSSFAWKALIIIEYLIRYPKRIFNDLRK